MRMKYLGSIALAGRVLLAVIFIASGLSKIPGWNDTVQYMEARGIPFVPLFLFPTIFIEVIGGLSILIGYRARLGAAVLFLFLIPTTLLFHDFWSFQGVDRQIQMVNFLKNLAIMGGLLQIGANGAGAMSVDRTLQERETRRRSKDLPRIRQVS